MRTITIESFEEFADRQGCEYVKTAGGMSMRRDRQNVRIVFRNGAVSDGENHIDPPTNPQSLLKVQEEYLRTKLKQEVKAYNDFLVALNEGANNHLKHPDHCGPIARNATEQLDNGLARIDALKKELEEVSAQVDPEKKLREQQWKIFEQERRERAKADLEAISKYKPIKE